MSSFIIERKSDDEYRFRLVTENGGTLLISETYISLASCQAGIDIVRRASKSGRGFVQKRVRSRFLFQIRSDSNGAIVATSEGYANVASLVTAIEEVKRSAPVALVFLNMAESHRNSSNRILVPQNSNLSEGLHLRDDNGQNYDDQQSLLQLQQEITNLKKRILELQEKGSPDREEKEEEVKLATELGEKQEVANIIPRIHPLAAGPLRDNEIFRQQFSNNTEINAVVVSIDIRRSTELMLKAKSHSRYSQFIMELSSRLCKAIIDNYGIFDKFTGDGILAFFPTFYSGEDAIMHAVQACKICHEIFHRHYKDNQSIFNVFIKDVGLGIGIDYGKVTLVNNDRELTLVGVPVVYACRMSGTSAHRTILNLPAFDHLMDRCGEIVHFSETEILIKHEGTALAYSVEFNERALRSAARPDWTNWPILSMTPAVVGAINNREDEKNGPRDEELTSKPVEP